MKIVIGETRRVCFAGRREQEMAESGAGQIVDEAPVEAKYDHLPDHVVWRDHCLEPECRSQRGRRVQSGLPSSMSEFRLDLADST